MVRAKALTRASSWNDAASIWSDIYRDSGNANKRAGIEAARANLQAGRPGVARSRAAELERRWPDDPEIWELLGMTHERLQDTAAAREAYMQVLHLAPGRPYALARMGVLTGDTVSVAGAPDGTTSIAQLEALGALRSVDVESLFELGLRAAETGRLDQAVLALDAAIESGDLSLAQRVQAAAALSPDRRTIPWLRSVVLADPLHTRGLTLLGVAQLAAGFKAAAVTTLEEAASSDPSDPDAMRAYADALTQTGQAGRAAEILDRIAPEPGDGFAGDAADDAN